MAQRLKSMTTTRQFPHSESVGHQEVKTPAATANMQEHNLMNVDPNREQFEPTDSYPVRNRARMGGS